MKCPAGAGRHDDRRTSGTHGDRPMRSPCLLAVVPAAIAAAASMMPATPAAALPPSWQSPTPVAMNSPSVAALFGLPPSTPLADDMRPRINDAGDIAFPYGPPNGSVA